MPSAAVPAVDKAVIGNAPSSATAQTAHVEELEKKIAELEKTISQLQQAAVVGADEKPAKEAKKVHHKKASTGSASHRKHRQVAGARPVVTRSWVLKAAKPGVAWVAAKGSSDLRMIEVGDFLKGLGKITAIVKD